MVIRTFVPSIPSEDVEEALKLSDSLATPKETRKEIHAARGKWLLVGVGSSVIVLVLGIIIVYIGAMGHSALIMLGGIAFIIGAPVILIAYFIKLLRGPSQTTPQKCTKDFYGGLLKGSDYVLVYPILAPSTMKKAACASLSKFAETWDGLTRLLASVVEEAAIRDEVTCSICAKKSPGVWCHLNWRLENLIGVLGIQRLKSGEHFLRCETCGAVYCTSCLVKIGGNYQCHSCETPLTGKHLKAFFTGPKIKLLVQSESASVIEQEQERVAHVIYEAEILAVAINPWLHSDNWIHLGEQGTLTCQFHNTAVKIGTKWYLLAGEPGMMSED